jgi:hypoxanthine phosphoribosyltransferase
VTTRLSWTHVIKAAVALAARWQDRPVRSVYGIPTGGCIVGALVAPMLGVDLVDQPDATRSLVVDDLADTGATLRAFGPPMHHDALYRKPHTPADVAPAAIEMQGWLHFPWEHDPAPVDAAVRLLCFCGVTADAKLAGRAATLLRNLEEPRFRTLLAALADG